MADTLEEAATPTIDNLQSVQTVLDMTVAEYLTTSLHRDLSALSATPALTEPAILPPYLPSHLPILIAQYAKRNSPRDGYQVVMMRSKVESWKEPDVLQNLCNALGVTRCSFTHFKVSLSIHESGARAMSIDVGSWEDLFPYVTKLWLVDG